MVVRSNLLLLKEIDPPDDLDVKWMNCFHLVDTMLKNTVNELEASSILIRESSKNNETHTSIVTGLLYGVLTRPEFSDRFVRYFAYIAKDWSVVTSLLRKLIIEKYARLLPDCQQMIIWFLAQLVKQDIPDCDHVCVSLLRFAGTQGSWLEVAMLAIFGENFLWVVSKNMVLLPYALYTYLRLLARHMHSGKEESLELIDHEASFCAGLFKEKFFDCLAIGRDLIRALQAVRHHPIFSQIWIQLLTVAIPQSPPPIDSLSMVPTPKQYLASRLPPEMENHLLFMMREVKLGKQKRYQQWFINKYRIAADEGEWMIPDIIRYICGVFHPPNSILQSEIIQRWAVIGWLLQCARTEWVSVQSRFALFHDYLFFNPRTDSIMDIEPAILLIHHSIPKYAALSNSLLSFLFDLLEFYDPNPASERSSHLRKNVQTAISYVREKGVVSSLDFIFSSEFIDTGVKERAKILLGPLERSNRPPPPPPSPQPPVVVSNRPPSPVSPSFEPVYNDQLAPFGTARDFSRDRLPLTLPQMLATLRPDLPIAVLAQFLANLPECFPDITPASTASSVCTRLNGLLFSALQLRVSIHPDPFDPLLSLYRKVREKVPYVGILFLCHLLRSNVLDADNIDDILDIDSTVGQTIFKSYEQLAHYLDNLEDAAPSQVLLDDSKQCLDACPFLFFDLLPLIFKFLPSSMIDSVEFIYSIVSSINPLQLHSICCRLVSGDFTIFSNRLDFMLDVIRASLKWKPSEQVILWQLIVSDVSRSMIDGAVVISAIFESIDPNVHHEAMQGMLSLLQSIPPVPQIFLVVIKLPRTYRLLSTAIIRSWEDRLAPCLMELFKQPADSLGDVQNVLSMLQRCSKKGNTVWEVPEVRNAFAAEFNRQLNRK